MASPQTENGYTRIANEILERFSLAGINGSEYRILFVVIRKTYGFGKTKDRISISQFQKYTQMNRANAIKTIKSLVAKRILVKDGSTYRFNKNYEEWVVAKRLPSSQMDTSMQMATTASSQMDTKSSSQMDTHKRKKETITKERGENKFSHPSYKEPLPDGAYEDDNGNRHYDEAEPKPKAKPKYREHAEELLKLYNDNYEKSMGKGFKPAYYPKQAYLRQVKPVIEHYGIVKLKEMLRVYLNSNDSYYKKKNYSLQLFLSHNVLADLKD